MQVVGCTYHWTEITILILLKTKFSYQAPFLSHPNARSPPPGETLWAVGKCYRDSAAQKDEWMKGSDREKWQPKHTTPYKEMRGQIMLLHKTSAHYFLSQHVSHDTSFDQHRPPHGNRCANNFLVRHTNYIPGNRTKIAKMCPWPKWGAMTCIINTDVNRQAPKLHNGSLPS